jgi:hypothetical protein
MRMSLAVLVSVLLLCPACGEKGFFGLPIPLEKNLLVSFQEGDGCLTYIEGHSANRLIRTIKITHQFADAGEVVRLTVPPGFSVAAPIEGWTVSADGRVIEGEIKPGEELCVPLNFGTIPPGQPEQDLSVVLESFVGETPILQDLIPVHLQSRPSQMTTAAFEMLTEAGLPVEDFVSHDVEKPRYESSWLQPKRQTEPVTDIAAHTTTEVLIATQKIAELAASFAPGAGATALTVYANTPLPAPEGDWLFVTMMLDAPIPLASAADEFQYVLALKGDADDSNDYMPSLAFPGDTFRNTDIQYALAYSAPLGWSLRATDSRGGGLQEIATAAWVAIRDNALMFAIPPGGFLPDPQLYLAAFRHDGTFGQQSPFDWSMDYVPLRGDEPD